MSSTATPRPTLQRELTARPLRCRNCGADRAAAPVSICDQCLGPIDPVYDPARPLPDANTIAARAPSLCRHRVVGPLRGGPDPLLRPREPPRGGAPAPAALVGLGLARGQAHARCPPAP